MVGPRMDPKPMVAPYAPRAAPRCSGENSTWMNDSTCGNISPLATPCSTRAAIRTPIVGAAEQTMLVAVKATIPIRNSRRRPKMSPSRAPVISMQANPNW